MVKAESSKDGAKIDAETSLHAAFNNLADSLIIASQACRNFAGGANPEALAAVMASIQASGVPFGAGAAPTGKKGSAKTPEQLERAEKKRKRAERKAAKDPNAPKRPASAYLMYQNEVRDHFKQQNPDKPYQEVLKMIGDSWKSMEETHRKAYSDRATQAMEEFKLGDQEYKQNHSNAAGVAAALAAQEDDEEEEEDDEIEEAEAEIPKSPSEEDSSEEEESSEDEAPAPVTKKSKKAVAPVVPAPTPKSSKPASKATAESATKKSKKEKKA